MNFQWAIQQMKAGKKVRCKSWQDKDSFLFVKNGLVYCHKERKAYFFLDSFEAIDWEIFSESSMKTADKEGKFYCQNCKTEVKFGQKFCTNCGRAQMWALFG